MSTLHILNGDASAERLAEARTPGRRLVYAELFHEGPVLEEGEQAFLRRRAGFFESRGWAERRKFLEDQRTLRRRRRDFAQFDEVILWFEHDLYDQLLLVHHLDFFSRQELGASRLSLICIGEFPGHDPFRGLGQLSPGEHASLLDRRREVSPRQLETGSRAWRAFRRPDPSELQEIANSPCPELPFLPGAFLRHLQEFPWSGDGLSRNQRQILQCVQEGGASRGRLLRRALAMEERPYLGDTTFFSHVRDLAQAAAPLLKKRRGRYHLTPDGENVLRGRADALDLNPADRWLGGVHLKGRRTLRWDASSGRLRGMGS